MIRECLQLNHKNCKFSSYIFYSNIENFNPALSPYRFICICENGVVMVDEALNHLNGTIVSRQAIIQGNGRGSIQVTFLICDKKDEKWNLSKSWPFVVLIVEWDSKPYDFPRALCSFMMAKLLPSNNNDDKNDYDDDDDDERIDDNPGFL